MSDAEYVATVLKALERLIEACVDFDLADMATPHDHQNAMHKLRVLDEQSTALQTLIAPRLDALAVKHLNAQAGFWGHAFLSEVRRDLGAGPEQMEARLRKRHDPLWNLLILLQNDEKDPGRRGIQGVPLGQAGSVKVDKIAEPAVPPAPLGVSVSWPNPNVLQEKFDALIHAAAPAQDMVLSLGAELQQAGLRESIYRLIEGNDIALATLRGLLYAAARLQDVRIASEDKARVDDLGHIQEKLDEIMRSQRWGEIRGELVKFSKLALAELTARTPSLGKEPARADLHDTESCNGESLAEPRGQFVDPIPRSTADLIAWLAKRTEWFRAWLVNPEAPLDPEYVEEIKSLLPPSNPSTIHRARAIHRLKNDPHGWAHEQQYRYVDRVLFEVHRQLDKCGISGQPTWSSQPVDEHWFRRANDHLSHLLNFLRTTSNTAESRKNQGEGGPVELSAPKTKSKRSTEKGEGRAKLIAALTNHHKYADGSCLNPVPIGNNALAEAAGVSPSTASTFFRKEFEGHAKYRAICRDAGKLVDYLKGLNGEFAAHELYGRRPPGEDDRDDGDE
jgi:hypothetical protein